MSALIIVRRVIDGNWIMQKKLVKKIRYKRHERRVREKWSFERHTYIKAVKVLNRLLSSLTTPSPLWHPIVFGCMLFPVTLLIFFVTGFPLYSDKIIFHVILGTLKRNLSGCKMCVNEAPAARVNDGNFSPVRMGTYEVLI